MLLDVAPHVVSAPKQFFAERADKGVKLSPESAAIVGNAVMGKESRPEFVAIPTEVTAQMANASVLLIAVGVIQAFSSWCTGAYIKGLFHTALV